MTFNAPHVDRLTRRWLRSAHAELGDGMLADLETVLVHHRRQNLCGLAYDAATLFEVPMELCEAVGTAAELLYCAFGMVDDIQDGDVDDYLPGDAGQQINVALALRELAMLRLLEVVPPTPMLDLVVRRVSETALQMCMSQREELAARAEGYGPPWSIDGYELVARGAAGAEVALLLSIVGVAVDLVGAAGVRNELMSETLHRLGYPVGVLLQVRVDVRTNDDRVTVLSRKAVKSLWMRYKQTLEREFVDSPALPDGLDFILFNTAGTGERPWHRSPSPTTPKSTSTPSRTRGSTRGTRAARG